MTDNEGETSMRREEEARKWVDGSMITSGAKAYYFGACVQIRSRDVAGEKQ